MTTPTLKKLLAGEVTLAETLDYIEAKIVEQGHPAIDSCGNCVYRDFHGSKCAVGHLISDEDHNSLNLSGNVKTILEDYPEVFGYTENDRTKKIVDILWSAQISHDAPVLETKKSTIPYNYVEQFKNGMAKTRRVYQLVIKEIDGEAKA